MPCYEQTSLFTSSFYNRQPVLKQYQAWPNYDHMEPINLEHLRELARRAYYWTSFSPERRGDAVIANYTAELNDDIRSIREFAPTDAPVEELEALLIRYSNRYISLLCAWLYSHSNVASSFVTGPANFPVARNQKRSNWANNHYNEFRSWRDRALKAIKKGLKPKISELDQARKNLESRIRSQRVMVTANKLIRKGGDDLREQLSLLGFSDAEIIRLLIPAWTNRKGFAPFQLSNNNAQIQRLKIRVALLEEKQKNADTVGSIAEEIKDVRLVQNYEIDRVQILFPIKPPKTVCQSLHKLGFIWTPSNKAWQRKLTRVAVTTAREFLQKL